MDRSQDEDRPFLAAGSRSGFQWYADDGDDDDDEGGDGDDDDDDGVMS